LGAVQSLELLTDAAGSIAFGWIQERVLYARFDGRLSADLGSAFARRLGALVEPVDSLKYFADARCVQSYDLLARSAFVRVLLAHRRKFEVLELLAPLASSGPASRSMFESLGSSATITTDAEEFELRLFAVAPSARWKLDAKLDARLALRTPLSR
jgi:hypothetical protein